jgi:hypothetical protein
VGIESHDVCNSRAVGDRIGVERMASSNGGSHGLLCGKIDKRRRLKNGKEN